MYFALQITVLKCLTKSRISAAHFSLSVYQHSSDEGVKNGGCGEGWGHICGEDECMPSCYFAGPAVDVPVS